VPLILAQEWGEIPLGEHRILVRYHTTHPIFAKTRFAWKDPAAAKLMDIPPPARRIERAPDPTILAANNLDPDDEKAMTGTY